MARAVGDAEQSVTYADRSGDAFMRMVMRTTHADALHQVGRRAEAETRFREAEQEQVERQPNYPLFCSLRGFRYCDLLPAAPERAAWRVILGSARGPRVESGGPPDSSSSHSSSPEQSAERGFRRAAENGTRAACAPLLDSCRAVSQRAAQTIKIAERNNWLLDIALDHLTLGVPRSTRRFWKVGRRCRAARPSSSSALPTMVFKPSAANWTPPWTAFVAQAA